MKKRYVMNPVCIRRSNRIQYVFIQIKFKFFNFKQIYLFRLIMVKNDPWIEATRFQHMEPMEPKKWQFQINKKNNSRDLNTRSHQYTIQKLMFRMYVSNSNNL